MSDSDPESIGPYRVIRRLGAGGMGEVFLAYDPRLDRKVAIKRIRREAGSDPGSTPSRRARFLREARVTASLSHPAIVQVHDLLEEGGADHIVMEHVAGTTLHHLLENGPLPLAEGLPIALALSEGLDCAHRHGVVHRDLKSENVLLTPDGAPKIADFGIARRPSGSGEETLTGQGAVLGTYRVMSPEQALGDPTDARSDLFALGVLFYEMFTGRSPFLAENGLATMRRVLHHRPPRASEVDPAIPDGLAELIDHLLEKEPVLRPHDAEEVAGRLRALGAGTRDGAPTLPPPDRRTPPVLPTPTPSRHRGRLLLALALLVGIAAAVGLGLRFLGRQPPLHVAVLTPRLDGQDQEDGTFLAFSVRGSLQSGLTSFEGIFPKGTGEVDAVSGKPADVARAVAADEVLEPAIACDGGTCRVALSRLGGDDGAVLWSGSIAIPRNEPLTAARALAVLLHQAYPDRRERPGVPALQVTPADYTEYLTLLRSVTDRRHRLDSSQILERLAAIRRRSPGFVEAYRLAATLQINELASTSRDPALADRALALLEEARKIAPGDPDLCYSSAYTALQAGRLDQAETAIATFEEKAPGDVRILDLQAALAERRGRPAEALALSRTAVERQPSWPRLYEHAKLARRQGETGEARRSLEQLLARFPGNEWGRRLLATLELTSGDPARAAALSEELLTRSAEPDLLANLGLARMLLGDHRGAAEALERAVAAEPRNEYFLLNLAQARQLEGRKAEGEALCRQVLELSADDPAGGWQRLTVRAQALAQLGDRQEAALAAQEALRLAPQNGQTAFEAALVFAMTGDYNVALGNAHRAHDLGFDAPAWFRLPWFEPLRSDAGFRRLAGL